MRDGLWVCWGRVTAPSYMPGARWCVSIAHAVTRRADAGSIRGYSGHGRSHAAGTHLRVGLTERSRSDASVEPWVAPQLRELVRCRPVAREAVGELSRAATVAAARDREVASQGLVTCNLHAEVMSGVHGCNVRIRFSHSPPHIHARAAGTYAPGNSVISWLKEDPAGCRRVRPHHLERKASRHASERERQSRTGATRGRRLTRWDFRPSGSRPAWRRSCP